MSEHKNHLSRAYGLDGVQSTIDFYDDWAATYDAEVSANGYATPGRCAEALAQLAEDPALPLLDIGCGTGLSGLALRKSGFTNIDGCDMTQGMLDEAAKLGLYRDLWVNDGSSGSGAPAGKYRLWAAIGVIGAGAARLSLYDTILGDMGAGDLFVFSFNDHTLEDPEFEGAVSNSVDSGDAELLFKEYGPHLPGKDMKSNVYVLKKR